MKVKELLTRRATTFLAMYVPGQAGHAAAATSSARAGTQWKPEVRLHILLPTRKPFAPLTGTRRKKEPATTHKHIRFGVKYM